MRDPLGTLDALEPDPQRLGPGAVLLCGRALAVADRLQAAIDGIGAVAPFRRMVTLGGFEMSVAMTNCDAAKWVTDRGTSNTTTGAMVLRVLSTSRSEVSI